MPKLYNASDICVLPSLMEATSIAGLEAMASGLPIVGTHVGGIPDIVKDGKTGLLVEPRNAKALAASINKLCLDTELLGSMGRDARTFCVESFDWDIIAEKTEAVYREAHLDYENNGKFLAEYRVAKQ